MYKMFSLKLSSNLLFDFLYRAPLAMSNSLPFALQHCSVFVLFIVPCVQ